ncbi:MAG: flagellar protein FlaG [Bryobacteraceae bacterium]|nr:flagellar protein FlaG [Bryobacteraceae bacterium]
MTQLTEAVQALNDAGTFGETLQLVLLVDQGTGRVVAQIVDRITGELVRQIPSECILRIARRLAALRTRIMKRDMKRDKTL